MKSCKICKENKPLSEFPKVDKKYYGSYCKGCMAAYQKGYQSKHRRKNHLRYLWRDMVNRCDRDSSYKGIKVCDEWLHFETFKQWSLENGYQLGYSPHRHDETKDYAPNNLVWIPLEEHLAIHGTTRITNDDKQAIRFFDSLGISVKTNAKLCKVSQPSVRRYK